jgi:chemotaxis protein MotB
VPKKAHHEEHENLEAWVIPYADLLTLLLAMFLALYATSNTDLAKLKEFASAFRSEVKGGSSQVVDAGISKGSDGANLIDMGGAGLLDGSGLSFSQSAMVNSIQSAVQTAGDKALAQQQAQQQAQQVEQQQFDTAKTQIENAVKGTALEGKLQFQQSERGLTVTVLTDGVLFGSGQADLAPQAFDLLGGLGQALTTADNEIEITGHTDSVGTDRSNRLLSTERANSVADYLVSRMGISQDRILVSGRGATQPLADNTTPEGRAKNRLVEITILSKSLTGAAVAPTGAASSTTSGGTSTDTATASTTGSTTETVAPTTDTTAGGQ